MPAGLNRIRDYCFRARQASFPELVYRTGQILQTAYLKHVVRNGREPVRIPSDNDASSLMLPSFIYENDEGSVSAIMEGKILALNQDPETISEIDQCFRPLFTGDIQINSLMDIRPVWEPARLQNTTLAFFCGAADRGPIGHDIQRFAGSAILGWIRENPFLRGAHYLSAMECGLRVPVFCYALRLLPDLSTEDRRLVLRTIYQHGWWISKKLSLYNSLGNHTICECIGLIFAGAVFPNAKAGRKWLETGVHLLNAELKHQILEDGGPAEQSFSYHRFVLDLYWLAADFLEKNSLHDCGSWKPRLIMGEEFLAYFSEGSRAPNVGDSDDGHAIGPGISPSKPDLRSRSEHRVKTFPQSGYTLVKSDTGFSLLLDHGPLGMPPLYNHGHADALSILVSKDGEDILVDSGTYQYNGAPEWRRYFKGTRAHNTVTIDRLDQAIQESGFIWSHPYSAGLIGMREKEGTLVLGAEHDGYSRLKDPVCHKRFISLLEGKDFVIKDSFAGNGRHQFELNFHLHPEATIHEENGWLKIRKGSAQIWIILMGSSRFEICQGEQSPIHGWFSPAYGIKMPSHVLTCIKEGKPEEVSFLTVISTREELPDLEDISKASWNLNTNACES